MWERNEGFFKALRHVVVEKWAPIMPAPRLPLAFAASLLLHAAVLGGGALLKQPRAKPTPAQTMLEATLRPADLAEPLIKDTLAEAVQPLPPAPPKPARLADQSAAPSGKQIAAATRKLAKHVYYPPEAFTRGIEGEVRLLLTLGEDGAVLDVAVASGSGHAILDQAAVRAAYAMGRLPGTGRREVLLPVLFRLTP